MTAYQDENTCGKLSGSMNQDKEGSVEVRRGKVS